MKKEEQEKTEKKNEGSGTVFIGYAVVVFTVLAVGLYVILVRSKG